MHLVCIRLNVSTKVCNYKVFQETCRLEAGQSFGCDSLQAKCPSLEAFRESVFQFKMFPTQGISSTQLLN